MYLSVAGNGRYDRELDNELEEMGRALFGNLNVAWNNGGYDITVDQNGNYAVSVNVPGVLKENLAVHIKEGRLHVHIRQGEKKKNDGIRYLVNGRRKVGEETFSIALPLKETEILSTKATLDNGVLTISITRREEEKPKTQEITIE